MRFANGWRFVGIAYGLAITGGGALARDLSSREALNQVDDPDGMVRATKQNDIDADQAYDSDRGPNQQ